MPTINDLDRLIRDVIVAKGDEAISNAVRSLGYHADVNNIRNVTVAKRATQILSEGEWYLFDERYRC